MGRHSGDQLAARPAVALALARSPQVFLAVAFTDELDALDIYAVHRAELCSYRGLEPVTAWNGASVSPTR